MKANTKAHREKVSKLVRKESEGEKVVEYEITISPIDVHEGHILGKVRLIIALTLVTTRKC